MTANPNKLAALLADERGATAIEYGLICALITLVVMTGISAMASGTGSMWGDIGIKVTNATK